VIFLLLLLTIVFNSDKTYTVVISALLILLLLTANLDSTQVLKVYFISFLIILIPFFIVDAVLTGTFIKEEVVWYNNSEFAGYRLLTVPIEDIGYAFSLILLNLLLTEKFLRFFNKPD
jgi:lycopene cyclase domain-containing protein